MTTTRSKKIFFLSGVIVWVLISCGTAQAQQDIPGSRDHPLLSRYPGSRISYYDQKDYSVYYVLEAPPGKSDYGLNDCRKVKLEGKVTRIEYDIPAGKSALEVFRNYESALQKAGFQVLARLTKKDIRDFLEVDCRFPRIKGFGSEDDRDHFYLSARTPARDKYVSVWVGEGYMGRPAKAAVGIVELKSMENGLITARGHVAIYGIHFDTDKAEIKPGSEPVLQQIATLLKNDPAMKLYVVGHTDNTGTLAHNMDLSKRRAEAVVKELVEKYGIDKSRLQAFGVGPLAPVATNSTEEGRALNRRVELLER